MFMDENETLEYLSESLPSNEKIEIDDYEITIEKIENGLSFHMANPKNSKVFENMNGDFIKVESNNFGFDGIYQDEDAYISVITYEFKALLCVSSGDASLRTKAYVSDSSVGNEDCKLIKEENKYRYECSGTYITDELINDVNGRVFRKIY